MKYCIVVAWHNSAQLQQFVDAWKIKVSAFQDFLILQQDQDKEGCAVTKNKGIQQALDMGAEVVIVLDSDCYPSIEVTLEEFAEAHLAALEPVRVNLYEPITDLPSRGTPYFNHHITMQVAASMGFWTENPDYDAVTTLTLASLKSQELNSIHFKRKAMFWRFFPFSGMNCAFRSEFWPYFKFDETAPRFDDIFMGYRLQAEAYKRGYCINLNGPAIRHVRQSNVWENLKIEAQHLERNETEWVKIYEASRSRQ